jgi:hypothetical protein
MDTNNPKTMVLRGKPILSGLEHNLQRASN